MWPPYVRSLAYHNREDKEEKGFQRGVKVKVERVRKKKYKKRRGEKTDEWGFGFFSLSFPI